MNKEFIPYEQALELKELGFDEPCFGWYPNDTAALSLHGVFIGKPSTGSYKLLAYAPTFSQAFRWFREKHGLLFWIEPSFKNQYETEGYVYYVKNNCPYSIDYATYEEAELACLNRLIEIVKNK